MIVYLTNLYILRESNNENITAFIIYTDQAQRKSDPTSENDGMVKGSGGLASTDPVTACYINTYQYHWQIRTHVDINNDYD